MNKQTKNQTLKFREQTGRLSGDWEDGQNK